MSCLRSSLRTPGMSQLATVLFALIAVAILSGCGSFQHIDVSEESDESWSRVPGDADDETARQARCTDDADCPGEGSCNEEGLCVFPDEADTQRQASRETTPQVTAGRLDDGGADAACGADRRCRIERLAARNRFRRRYDAARYEHMVEEEIAQFRDEQVASVPRLDSPTFGGFHFSPLGVGLRGGHAFLGGVLRAEGTLLNDDDRVHYNPDDPEIPTISESHDTVAFGAHLTYLPVLSTLTPVATLGFTLARGEIGGGWSSNWEADLEYHFLTGSVGVEMQIESGLIAQLAVHHGRVIYNQVRYSAGNYDSDLRDGLREHMNSDGLLGASFTIGWAF